MPRFAIFDLFRTLVPGTDQGRRQVMTEMAAILGVDPAGLLDAYNQTWRLRMTRWDVAETVRVLARRLGGAPSPEQVAEAADLRRALAGRLLADVSEATLQVLDSLRAEGYRLGLISNAAADTSEAWPGSVLAARFDVAVFSCVVGLAKPDPAIFLNTARMLGARAEECAYIGDGANDELAGAAGVGMRVIRTTEFGDSDPSWPGPGIPSLTALLPLLSTGAGAQASL
jgi:putative hydrolase of the HAD superfamily